MEYRYWDWGDTPKRDDFQLKVLRLALDKTVAAYGPYSIKRTVESMSTLRIRREIVEGKRFNVHAGPWRLRDSSNPLDTNIAINVPILGPLLGYRRLLIRREDQPKFGRIVSADQLKQLTAGQGRDWAEVALYRNNGYKVDDSGNLHTLIAMLENRRVDYVPMSVLEVESMLARHPGIADKVMVAPDIFIAYPLPTIFYVSPKEPRLATRLERGLVIARRDGSLDELLQRYFKAELQSLNVAGSRVFTFDNPEVPRALLYKSSLLRPTKN